MAENDGQEKTEAPTGKRISEARKKGQVPRSREMGTFSVLISGVLGLWAFNPLFKSAFKDIFELGFSVKREALFDPKFMVYAFLEAIKIMALPITIFGLFVIIIAIIGNLLIGGYNFSISMIGFKFNKLSPLNGLKRMFGIQSVIELIKSLLKVSFIGGCAYLLISVNMDSIINLPSVQFPSSIKDALYIILKIAICIVCSIIPIAALDAWFQKWHTMEQLKMTKQEVKDEYKETEGKPEVKGRIRRLQMEAASRRMMQDVPKADVVVTNPTHYSVALKYDQSREHSAPQVVAKGVDEVAFKIREVAKSNNVTIIESPALARAIYYSTELGREIPEGLFAAVAQVLAYVFQLKMYKARRAMAPKPLAKDLPIPDELKHD